MRFRLITKLHEDNVDVDAFAKRLAISRSSLQDKLFGLKPFTLAEIERILRVFPDATFEELFPKEEDKR